MAIPATEIRDAVVRDDTLVLTLADSQEVVVDATLTQSGQAADAKVTGDVVSQLKDDFAAEKTAREEADNDLRADLTANANADAETKRSLNALWKLNQGISYQFETDNTAAYRKTVPSGAKLASVENVGGKTVVWNQLLKNRTFDNTSNWHTEDKVSLSVDNNVASVNSGIATNGIYQQIDNLKVSHKYYMYVELKSDIENYEVVYGCNDVSKISIRQKITANWCEYCGIKTCAIEKNMFFIYSPTIGTFDVRNTLLIDLTQLFGAGNEPTDRSDSRIAWIEQYAAAHPEYNAGELISADVESVIERGKNMALLQQGSLGLSINVGGGLGNEFDSAARLRTNFIPISTGVKYKATYFDNLTVANGIAYDKNKNPINYSYYPDVNTGIFTVDNDEVKYIRLILRHIDGIDITPDCRFQFEVGETSTQYSPYHENTYAIPASIRALPGYGWSAGSVYNSIERTETGWQYVQRVGEYVFDGTENWIARDVGYCYFTNKHFDNGLKIDNANFLTNVEGEYKAIRVRADGNGLIARYRDANVTLTLDEVKSRFSPGKILYYEYKTPIITDITDLMADFPDHFEVEAVGMLTFENAAQLPVPSSVEYLISLAEVNG